MELPSCFAEFLSEIRLTKSMRDDLITGHTTLRNRLHEDENLKSLIVDSFLQGSYRRATAVRPKNGRRADVDVVVVTRIKRSDYPDPEKAMDLFVPFLEEHYKGKYRKQGRSFCIELSYVEMDMVIASAPSEEESLYKSLAVTTAQTLEEAVDWRLMKSWQPLSTTTILGEKPLLETQRSEKEWQTEPLWIPDREIKVWQQTHPLEQMKWTSKKNKVCNGHYVNVVKALKWWEIINHENARPKGYPLEHLIGDCCPDGIESVAEGMVTALENISKNYAIHAALKSKPILPDRGIPTHDVFARITGEQFAEFWGCASEAAKVAREAYDAKSESESSQLWRQLLGDKFPKIEEEKKNNTYENSVRIGAPIIIKGDPAKPWNDC